MFRLNREGVFLDYKAYRQNDLYVPAEKIIGGHARDLLPPVLADQVLDYIGKALEGRTMQQWEYQLLMPGGMQDFEARMVPYGSDDVVAIVRNITAIKEADRILRTSLREKESLLQEVHHRVKNNLQVISSLINMQLRRMQEAAGREALEECQHRVQAIALVHEKLYQSENMTNVPLPEYVRSLARDIVQAASVAATLVSCEVTVENIALPIDKAVPCGLILNELITNALRHAFPNGRQGSIHIRCERVDAGHLRFEVADDGVGLPPDLDVNRCQSMGLQLVNALAAQLDAQLEVNTHGGASFKVTLPMAS
jgi:two-component sensor histidine kinase